MHNWQPFYSIQNDPEIYKKSLRRMDQNFHVDLSFLDNSGRKFIAFFKDNDWHYCNSGPEKMRSANSKKIFGFYNFFS